MRVYKNIYKVSLKEFEDANKFILTEGYFWHNPKRTTDYPILDTWKKYNPLCRSEIMMLIKAIAAKS